MDWFFTGIILTNFIILGSSRLINCIHNVALQGAFISLLFLFGESSTSDFHRYFLTFSSLIIKAIAIPLFLIYSLRQTKIKQEVEPTISLHLSLLAGGIILVASFLEAKSFSIPTTPFSSLILPTALLSVFIGFFLLISRSKAITQVIGFLVLENGVFLFGMTLVGQFSLIVEMGLFLDLLVCIFIMGIMLHQINKTFDHIDTKSLNSLKDTE